MGFICNRGLLKKWKRYGRLVLRLSLSSPLYFHNGKVFVHDISHFPFSKNCLLFSIFNLFINVFFVAIFSFIFLFLTLFLFGSLISHHITVDTTTTNITAVRNRNGLMICNLAPLVPSSFRLTPPQLDMKHGFDDDSGA